MPNVQSEISALIESFASQLVAITEAAAAERIQAALADAFGAAQKRGSGRATVAGLGAKAGRPKQLCPVPGCTGVAAPVFGMVCAKHKDMPKAKIKEFRAQRRAAKAD